VSVSKGEGRMKNVMARAIGVILGFAAAAFVVFVLMK
jgi:hypothetical protein